MRKQKNSKPKHKQYKSKTKISKSEHAKKEKKTVSKEQLIKKQEQFPIKQQGFSIEQEGLSITINMHKRYKVEIESEIGKNIKNWFTLYMKKEDRKNKKLMKIVEFSYFPHFQFQLMGEKPGDEKCSICQFQYEALANQEAQEQQLMEETEEDLVILRCSHLMHYSCFTMLVGEKQWIKCPVCSTIFGKMIGDQPPGNMNYTIDNFTRCDGYPDCGTISISYHMHAGKRGDINFPGTHRHAYLPDNDQGRQVLRLLQQAFNRKLIFTIGRSVTTGRDNQIVWNGIHHKTNLSGGSAYFGYPDPTYFDRVKLELAAKGVY